MSTLWHQLPDGVDASPLETLANDTSLEILYALLGEFQTELADMPSVIDRAVGSNDRASMSNCFHTAKGLAATFGLKELRSKSEALELRAADAPTEEFTTLQTAFGDELTKASGLVGELLGLVEKHL